MHKNILLGAKTVKMHKNDDFIRKISSKTDIPPFCPPAGKKLELGFDQNGVVLPVLEESGVFNVF